jgi:hypothetical protein
MGKLVVINHVTLDGVMQGSGRPDEDTRDGFEAGGWALIDSATTSTGVVIATYEPARAEAGVPARGQ